MASNDETLNGRLRRPEGARRSGGHALLFWAIALLAGGAAALLVRVSMNRTSRPAGPALVKIAVTTMDLPVATTLRQEHLKLVPWPVGAQPPGSFTDPKEIVGRVLLTYLVKGEPVLGGKLASRDKGQGLAALIPVSMRAVAVRVDDVVGVAGFIHPEDRVDVIVTMKPKKPADSEPISKVILQNVKVLAVGQEIDPGDERSKPLAVKVATLLVTPEQSERLALAVVEGKVLLTLRSLTDDDSVDTSGVMAAALLKQPRPEPPPAPAAPVVDKTAARRSGPRRPAPAVAAAAPAAPPKEVVEILRGDRFEERKFDAKEKEKKP